MTPPNTQFIELHPEAALRLAWTLQLRDVAHAALRVLAVERAIEALGNPHHYPHRPTAATTLFGRPRPRDQDLPEEMEAAVAKAARSLAGRAQHTCERLFSVGMGVGGDPRSKEWGEQPDVFDWLGVEEWGVLRRMGAWSEGFDAGVRAQTMQLIFAVAAGLRAHVEAALVLACSVDPAEPLYGACDEARRCVAPRDSLMSTAVLYAGLSPAQRLLTPVFWDQFTALLVPGGVWLGHAHLSEAGLQQNVLALNTLLLFESLWRAYPPVISASAPVNVATESSPASVPASAAGEGQGGAAAESTSPQQERLRFSLENFYRELGAAIRGLAAQWTCRDIEIPTIRTDYLNLCLTEHEFRFLPRWDALGGREDDGNAAQPESSMD